MNSFRSRPSRAPAKPAGFTLLELVLVLFVMALAALVVFPDLRPMLESVGIQAAVKKTATFLDGVRTRAVLENTTLVVALSEDGGGFIVSPEGREEEVVDAHRVEAVAEGTLEELSLAPKRIVYYPKGSSSGGEIAFSREGTMVSAIRVGSFTGLARIVGEDR